MLLGREHVYDRRMTKPAAAGSALLASTQPERAILSRTEGPHDA